MNKNNGIRMFVIPDAELFNCNHNCKCRRPKLYIYIGKSSHPNIIPTMRFMSSAGTSKQKLKLVHASLRHTTMLENLYLFFCFNKVRVIQCEYFACVWRRSILKWNT